jgi:threonine dehydrogenase-like Zn-dependent dehydrogenase
MAEVGFLIEPLSNIEKAMRHATASRSAFTWRPERAFVLGNGPLGLLGLARLHEDERFDRWYCLGRRTRPDPTIEIIERLGATYVNSTETPISSVPDVHEPQDLIIEATGVAAHAFETIHALAPNGVGVLLGIPGEDSIDLPAGALHSDIVLSNKALLGSVNSNVDHFVAARETLDQLPDWFLDALVTGCYPPSEAAEAFEDEGIKTVIDFATD